MKIACSDIDTQEALDRAAGAAGRAAREIDVPGVKKLANLNGDYVLALQRDESADASPALAEDRVALSVESRVPSRVVWSSGRRRRLPAADGLAGGARPRSRARPSDAGRTRHRRVARRARGHRRRRPDVPVADRPPRTGRGHYEVDGDTSASCRRFPFLADHVVHRARASVAAARTPTTTSTSTDFERFTITRAARRPERRRRRVVAVHPTRPRCPRNLLRFYVHFSAPMSEGFVAGYVHVVDAAHRRDRRTERSLPMDPELWDPRPDALTVLFDPARIKRGLAPHREAGYPLHEGATRRDRRRRRRSPTRTDARSPRARGRRYRVGRRRPPARRARRVGRSRRPPPAPATRSSCASTVPSTTRCSHRCLAVVDADAAPPSRAGSRSATASSRGSSHRTQPWRPVRHRAASSTPRSRTWRATR